MQEGRVFERFDGDHWTKVPMVKLRKGDKFRIFDDGEVVMLFCPTATKLIATSYPYKDGDSVMTIQCEAAENRLKAR